MTVKRQAPKNVFHASWLFGHPVVRANLNSAAYWSRPTTSPLNAKGGGWMPCLHPRVNTGDDWSALYIPVNEYPVTLFNELQYSYYMTSAQSSGVNPVIWLHDPEDFDDRVEVTYEAAEVDKGAGWNAFEFSTSADQNRYYGELSTAASGKTNLSSGTKYTWAEYQADNLFKNWVIYRISIEAGWLASSTFDQCWVAELKLNEVPIPLIPREGDLVPVHTYYTGSANIATTEATINPRTPFQLLSVSFHVDVNPGQASAYVIQVLRDNDKHATYYDTVLHSSDIYVPTTTTSRHVIFGEGYEFDEDDVIDILWTNNSKNYGIVYTWKPL